MKEKDREIKHLKLVVSQQREEISQKNLEMERERLNNEKQISEATFKLTKQLEEAKQETQLFAGILKTYEAMKNEQKESSKITQTNKAKEKEAQQARIAALEVATALSQEKSILDSKEAKSILQTKEEQWANKEEALLKRCKTAEKTLADLEQREHLARGAAISIAMKDSANLNMMTLDIQDSNKVKTPVKSSYGGFGGFQQRRPSQFELSNTSQMVISQLLNCEESQLAVPACSLSHTSVLSPTTSFADFPLSYHSPRAEIAVCNNPQPMSSYHDRSITPPPQEVPDMQTVQRKPYNNHKKQVSHQIYLNISSRDVEVSEAPLLQRRPISHDSKLQHNYSQTHHLPYSNLLRNNNVSGEHLTTADYSPNINNNNNIQGMRRPSNRDHITFGSVALSFSETKSEEKMTISQEQQLPPTDLFRRTNPFPTVSASPYCEANQSQQQQQRDTLSLNNSQLFSYGASRQQLPSPTISGSVITDASPSLHHQPSTSTHAPAWDNFFSSRSTAERGNKVGETTGFKDENVCKTRGGKHPSQEEGFNLASSSKSNSHRVMLGEISTNLHQKQILSPSSNAGQSPHTMNSSYFIPTSSTLIAADTSSQDNHLNIKCASVAGINKNNPTFKHSSALQRLDKSLKILTRPMNSTAASASSSSIMTSTNISTSSKQLLALSFLDSQDTLESQRSAATATALSVRNNAKMQRITEETLFFPSMNKKAAIAEGQHHASYSHLTPITSSNPFFSFSSNTSQNDIQTSIVDSMSRDKNFSSTSSVTPRSCYIKPTVNLNNASSTNLPSYSIQQTHRSGANNHQQHLTAAAAASTNSFSQHNSRNTQNISSTALKHSSNYLIDKKLLPVTSQSSSSSSLSGRFFMAAENNGEKKLCSTFRQNTIAKH